LLKMCNDLWFKEDVELILSDNVIEHLEILLSVFVILVILVSYCQAISTHHFKHPIFRNQSNEGPRYSSSTPNTEPFCLTSILPSCTKLLAASLVGSIRSRQSKKPKGNSPRFAIARGISLGQHVFVFCLLCNRASISALSCACITSAEGK